MTPPSQRSRRRVSGMDEGWEECWEEEEEEDEADGRRIKERRWETEAVRSFR